MNSTRVIHFYYQTGCAACEEAQPALNDFVARHALNVMVLRHNVRFSGRLGNVAVEATPTYILTIDGTPVATHVGVMGITELESFMRPRAAAPKRRKRKAGPSAPTPVDRASGDDDGASEPESEEQQPEITETST